MAEKPNHTLIPGWMVAGAAALVGYLLLARPWHLQWGATAQEAHQPLPGDELIAQPQMAATHAMTIHTSARAVWSWLVQIGQGRGGFYSYDWLENLIGLDIHTAGRIDPRLQALEVGDRIPFSRQGGLTVFALQPCRLLVLAGTLYREGIQRAEYALPGDARVEGTWVFLLDEINAQTTRLVVRTRIAAFQPVGVSWLFLRLLEPAHFLMERKMLLGIKKRSEQQQE